MVEPLQSECAAAEGMRRTAARLVALTALAIGLSVASATWTTGGGQDHPSPGGAKPFFPVGLYYTPRARFSEFHGLRFNVVHVWALPDGSSALALDDAARLGLKVVV